MVELVHLVLNAVLVPLGILTLFFATPLLTAWRFLSWAYRSVFPDSVSGKVVVITGASSGIGEQSAYIFASKGARLALAARREENLAHVAHRSRQLGSPDVLEVPTDVSKVDDCQKLIDETVRHFGRLDYLFNNAGLAHSFLLERAETTEIGNIMDINFWGSIYPTYYALPHLKKSRGRIIVTSSVASFLPYPRMAIYNAAKAALLNFFATLRVEMGNDVGVTVATPGWFESEMTAGKFMTARGQVEWDKRQRDLHVGPFPVEPAKQAAQAIVNGALRGQNWVQVPWWYSTLLLYRVFAPDVVESFTRLIYAAPVGGAPLSKYLADTGVPQRVLYPESIAKLGAEGGKAQ